MTEKVRPILDRVVVEPDPEEEKTESGLYLPPKQKHEHPPRTGTVVAVGPGLYDDNGERIKMTVKPGDRIQFKGYAGVESVWDDKEVLVITEPDIFFIFESLE